MTRPVRVHRAVEGSQHDDEPDGDDDRARHSRWWKGEGWKRKAARTRQALRQPLPHRAPAWSKVAAAESNIVPDTADSVGHAGIADAGPGFPSLIKALAR